ncbi:MAG TPA: N-6 DNA methylase, partial [Verrucomicrobiota bacterium]|nr:N-6 DNA methylase [Verrucomicrobiota bacterium]
GGTPTPVTLDECEELASELGAKDGFDLACRFAGKTLPGVFRAEDPVLELTLAPESQVELRRMLAGLKPEVFTADDSLGWTYQFWQALRKEEVNKSGKKIGAAELSPVTQLFTEDYMVEFLLHNTLGAWWAGKVAQAFSLHGTDEAAARAAVALSPKNGVPGIEWTYLRFVQDDTNKTWVPAAGTFPGWPRAAREITMLDPSMGSGHFLVFALPLLVRLRIEEENLSAAAAVTAVLRDNLHGLELDERCTQIAAFNLALAAWKLGGYQPLPSLHLACSGLAPHTTQAEWVALAGDDEKLQRGMARLYKLFEDAPVLGSLINPRAGGGDLLTAGFDELRPLVEKALAPATADDTAREMAVTARGLAKAAELLAGQFTLVATNVPYLGRRKQNDTLKEYCEIHHNEAKAELATSFMERGLAFCSKSGSAALLVPQNWLFLGSFEEVRKKFIECFDWNIVCRMGAKAFQTPMYDFGVAMHVFTKSAPSKESMLAGLDVSTAQLPNDKSALLKECLAVVVNQLEQLKNPDTAIVFESTSPHPLLQQYADSYQGSGLADIIIFRKLFWELSGLNNGWVAHQSSPSGDHVYTGMHFAVKWDDGNGALVESPEATIRGRSAWGRIGIACAWLGRLPAGIYLGTLYDNSAAAIIPKDPKHLQAVWCFMASPEFPIEVRKVNQKTQVANATLVKVPFDLAHWQRVAAEKYPNGLPKPTSSDPTQWLFNGHPKGSDQPLHVALARLLGYRWPRQTGSSFPDCPALDPDGLESFADTDGIVCLAPINREQPAAARLRHLLAAALGTYDERALLAAAGPKGSKSKILEDWLRDEAFEQHCAIFHDRPFIWHLWDGLKDGFHVLVNYHRLDHATLEKLTFSYLGEWIRQQADDAKADKPGAAARLGAAQALQDKLKAILTGEAPLDIFVRWKPLNAQPIGWNPDLNDGLRQNIRPFLLAGDVAKKGAGLFRAVPLKLKESDRGTEPERPRADYPWFWCEEDPGTDPSGGRNFVGTRWNTTHLTLATKRAARL